MEPRKQRKEAPDTPANRQAEDLGKLLSTEQGLQQLGNEAYKEAMRESNQTSHK